MFEPVRESCAIAEVIIYNEEEVLSYEELKAQYEAAGYKPVSEIGRASCRERV